MDAHAAGSILTLLAVWMGFLTIVSSAFCLIDIKKDLDRSGEDFLLRAVGQIAILLGVATGIMWCASTGAALKEELAYGRCIFIADILFLLALITGLWIPLLVIVDIIKDRLTFRRRR